MELAEGNERVVIERVSPEIDGGRFSAKSIAGDEVTVEADIFADGHDALSARLLYRREDEMRWAETPMQLLTNDRWQGSFSASEPGRYFYTVTAWVDSFQTWRQDLNKRIGAKQKDLPMYLFIGTGIMMEAAGRASGADGKLLHKWLDTLKSDRIEQKDKLKLVMSDEISKIMGK